MPSGHERRVAEAIWPWWKPAGKAACDTDFRVRCRRSAIQVTVMAAIGLLLFFAVGHRVMAMVVWVLAAFVLVSGLFLPKVFHRIERFGALLGKGAAAGLTWLLLTPAFYLIFAPGRLILKLRGTDPMRREWPSSEPTYWVPRKPPRDMNQYRKQH